MTVDEKGKGETRAGPSAVAPGAPSPVTTADGPALGTPGEQVRLTQQYAMNTPENEDRTRTVGTHDDQEEYESPDAIMNVPSALEVWQQDTASFTNTEGSDDRGARLERMTVRLAALTTSDARITTEGIEFLRLVEETIADDRISFTEWMSEDPEARKDYSLQAYAEMMMWELEYYSWNTKEDLKMNIYALTKITRGALSQARESAELIWQRIQEWEADYGGGNWEKQTQDMT